MCGIAGILGRVNDANEAALRRMAAALAHRGPDAEGFWKSSPDARGEGCLLAHRRLAILDLTSAAAQPMTDPRGQTIIFNGEIYNYLDLRRGLAAAGQTVESSGDTAVLLRLLAMQGHQALSKLRGMFALALWDDAKRSLLLARDPLGIKPLYVCHNPQTDDNREWSLLFASEVRAILAAGLLRSPRLDTDAVASVVWNGFVMGPGTAVRGVESVAPGEFRLLDGRGNLTQRETFWSIPMADSGAANAAELREVLGKSVRLHLASDVALGVFLSGGIDSSAVAHLAQKSSDRPIHTFTLAFEEPAYNEAPHARAVAAAIGTEHQEVVLSEGQFVASLEAALDSLDQPTFDALNSYYISKAVREAGLTVALVGTGGDELFGGYSSFRHVPSLRRWARRASWVPQAAKVGAARIVAAATTPRPGALAAQTRWAKLPEMVRAGDDLVRLYQLSYALFLPDFQAQLLDGTAAATDVRLGLPPAMHQKLRRETDGRSSLAALSVLEQRCFLGERLLRDIDAASMAVSLETRLPLVDQVVLETVIRLPDELRYQPLGRKQILRDVALGGLDPRLFERPKRGFEMPFGAWARRRLGGQMDAVMRDRLLAARVGLSGDAVARLWQAFQDGAPGLYWSRVWALYVLLRWCDRHGVWSAAASPQNVAALPPPVAPGRKYCLISPCRDEAAHLRRTLESVAAQTIPPSLWIVIDDGSTDQTPAILEEYAAKLPYLRVIHLPDRGFRQLGSGVVEAFYAGYNTINPDDFDFICKLDMDLDLPPRYFELLIERMEKNPRIGTCSGKPFFRDRRGRRVSEMCGDETSVGMTKFYRTACFRQIGGFEPALMWDGIDCHRCRMLGWIAVSWEEEQLSFEHLRPMGSSDRSWWTGRVRHGAGQYFMGTGPIYMLGSALFRMTRPPLLIGGVAILWGYLKSMLSREPRYRDAGFRRFLSAYQWRCLLQGKRRATEQVDARQASQWKLVPAKPVYELSQLARFPAKADGNATTEDTECTENTEEKTNEPKV